MANGTEKDQKWIEKSIREKGKKSKFLRVAAVPPTLNWERKYERIIKKAAVTPFLDKLNKTFAEALLHVKPAELITPDMTFQINNAIQGVNLDQVKLKAAVDDTLRKLGLQHTMKVNRVFKRAIGVDILPLLQTENIQRYFDLKITENVDLIVTMSEKHKDELFHKLQRQLVSNPFDRQEVARFLDEFDKAKLREFVKKYMDNRNQNVEYNLRRICRDQNNKMIGQLNEIRQTELGIESYEWSTSLDIRVRPTHRVNEGKVFRWDQPPSTGHPGWDIQCRCTSHAILDSRKVDKIRKDVQALRPRQKKTLPPIPKVPLPKKTHQLNATEQLDWAKKRLEVLEAGPEGKDYKKLIVSVAEKEKDLIQLHKEYSELNRKISAHMAVGTRQQRTKGKLSQQWWEKRNVQIDDRRDRAAYLKILQREIQDEKEQLRKTDPRRKVEQEMRQRLLRPESEAIETPELEIYFVSTFKKAEKVQYQKRIEAAILNYRRLAGEWPDAANQPKLRIKVSKSYIRAYASEREKLVNIGLNELRNDENLFAILAHELEHQREYAIRRVTGKLPGLKWMHKKTKNESARKLSELVPNRSYNPRERARKDKFLKPYIGKEYRHPDRYLSSYPKAVPDPYGVQGTSWIGTETQTVGIEFYSAERLNAFENKSILFDDPSYFRFLMKNVFGR